MKLLTVIHFVLLFSSCCFAQSNSYFQCLGFATGKDGKLVGWISDPSLPMLLKIDSSKTTNKKLPLHIDQKNVLGINLRLNASIQNKLILPEKIGDSLKIVFTCKGLNLESAYFIITGLDKQENILRSDTMFVAGNDDWHTFAKSISIKNTALIHLNIEALGVEKICNQGLWLDKIGMFADGKSIDEFQLPDLTNDIDLELKDVVPLSFSNHQLYNDIPNLKNTKIVALGESIHGSKTISHAAFDLIKFRVENANCKLILLELPFEQMLSFNRFAQGDESFKLDSLMQDFRGVYLLKEIVLWVKEYNKVTNEKVWLMGMDVEMNEITSRMLIFEYLNTLNKTVRCASIDSLCSNLFNSNPFTKTLSFLENHGEIKSALGEKEYKLLSHCLSIFKKIKSRQVGRFPLRDYLMYDNAKFLTEILCSTAETVSIYSHLVHTNYISENSIFRFKPSFGFMMKKGFGNDYSCIGLFTEKGNCTVNVPGNPNVAVKPLQMPPFTSFEYVLGKINADYFYLPISKLPENPIFIRELGLAFSENQFNVLVLASRMDAAIFVRHSEAIQLTQVDLNRIQNNDIYYRFKKNLNKNLRNK